MLHTKSPKFPPIPNYADSLEEFGQKKKNKKKKKTKMPGIFQNLSALIYDCMK